jgi:hypothetical protein
MTTKKLIKQQYGVSLFEDGNYLQLYIEELQVLNMHKEFKDLIMKSYDNLIKLRKSEYPQKS